MKRPLKHRWCMRGIDNKVFRQNTLCGKTSRNTTRSDKRTSCKECLRLIALINPRRG